MTPSPFDRFSPTTRQMVFSLFTNDGEVHDRMDLTVNSTTYPNACPIFAALAIESGGEQISCHRAGNDPTAITVAGWIFGYDRDLSPDQSAEKLRWTLSAHAFMNEVDTDEMSVDRFREYLGIAPPMERPEPQPTTTPAPAPTPTPTPDEETRRIVEDAERIIREAAQRVVTLVGMAVLVCIAKLWG